MTFLFLALWIWRTHRMRHLHPTGLSARTAQESSGERLSRSACILPKGSNDLRYRLPHLFSDLRALDWLCDANAEEVIGVDAEQGGFLRADALRPDNIGNSVLAHVVSAMRENDGNQLRQR